MSKTTLDLLLNKLNEAERMDQETGHYEADNILIEALIDASRGDLNQDEAWQIVEAYSKISKWYA